MDRGPSSGSALATRASLRIHDVRGVSDAVGPSDQDQQILVSEPRLLPRGPSSAGFRPTDARVLDAFHGDLQTALVELFPDDDVRLEPGGRLDVAFDEDRLRRITYPLGEFYALGTNLALTRILTHGALSLSPYRPVDRAHVEKPGLDLAILVVELMRTLNLLRSTHPTLQAFIAEQFGDLPVDEENVSPVLRWSNALLRSWAKSEDPRTQIRRGDQEVQEALSATLQAVGEIIQPPALDGKGHPVSSSDLHRLGQDALRRIEDEVWPQMRSLLRDDEGESGDEGSALAGLPGMTGMPGGAGSSGSSGPRRKGARRGGGEGSQQDGASNKSGGGASSKRKTGDASAADEGDAGASSGRHQSADRPGGKQKSGRGSGGDQAGSRAGEDDGAGSASDPSASPSRKPQPQTREPDHSNPNGAQGGNGRSSSAEARKRIDEALRDSARYRDQAFDEVPEAGDFDPSMLERLGHDLAKLLAEDLRRAAAGSDYGARARRLEPLIQELILVLDEGSTGRPPLEGHHKTGRRQDQRRWAQNKLKFQATGERDHRSWLRLQGPPPEEDEQWIICLDRSESMNNKIAGTPKIEAVRDLAVLLIEAFRRARTRRSLGVIAFGDKEPTVLKELTRELIPEEYKGLIALLTPSGLTPDKQALGAALKMHDEGGKGRRITIFVSDGEGEQGQAEAVEAAETQGRSRIVGLGLGEAGSCVKKTYRRRHLVLEDATELLRAFIELIRREARAW